MIAMKKLIEPVGEALADYEIFAAVARPLGKYEDFTENRTKRQWLAFLFETTRKALAGGGHDAPAFEEFWEIGELHLPLNPTAVDRRGPSGRTRPRPRFRRHQGRSKSFRRRLWLSMCVHGNPNILTRDVGTSKLAQGCTGQITKVEVERFSGDLPPVRIFEPMKIAEQAG
jgi:anaerobic selenocysteine-containing dehydrogenase